MPAGRNPAFRVRFCASSLIVVLIVAIAVAVGAAAERLPVPKLAGRVTDNARVLRTEDRARIEKMLEKYERETFHQIAVLTITTLAGEPIEAYSLRVGNAWQLGHKGIDNGILVTVALKDHKARIDLGLGMAKYISNDEAHAVIAQKMVPSFKRANYPEGLEAGLQELMRLGRRFVVKKEDVERAKAKK